MATEGIQFGRYLLLRRIASGGMAEIFLAKQQGPGRFERTLVIKRILPHLAQDPKFVGMFLDEAALAAQLSHPHIAQLYDFGDEGGQYYLALELVRGPDLASIIGACQTLRKPPPAEISVRLVSQMLEALHYAHGAVDEQGQPLRLVHRDVSPQNALCSLAGVVKLIDFGIAKAASAMQRTDTGMVKGKFTYMAPEQLRGEPLDGRCDLYASALVLYEMLSLQVALQGEGTAAISNALEARIVPLEQLRPDLPPALLAAVRRALQKNRNDRFADCAEFGAALEKVLASQGAMVLAPQIADYLKLLEAELGAPLSPVGLGSSSGEKVPSVAASAGSGPHDTKISGATPERLAPAVGDTALTIKNLPAAKPAARPPAPPKRSSAGVWLGLAVLLVAAVAAAGGWRWYSQRESSKAFAEVVPEPAPLDAALPPVPAAPKTPRPAAIAKVDPEVQAPPSEPPERHPNSRNPKHRTRERADRAVWGDKPDFAKETAAGESPPPPSASASPAPAAAPKPNYRQIPPPNYQQQQPYYQNNYYQQGYPYQQPQQPQQAYPYGQQQQYPQQSYPR
jgi:eukaryotic-like serine/threonine-protein kinase